MKQEPSIRSIIEESKPSPMLFKFDKSTKSTGLKIIFLDVDGVIYPGRTVYQHDERRDSDEFSELLKDETLVEQCKDKFSQTLWDISALMAFDKDCVKRVIRLCEETGAHIVLSSAWRERRSLDQIRRLFAFHGLDKYIIDKTTENVSGRARQVEQWLIEHAGEVDNFVALDDDASDFYDRFPEHFICCEYNQGFTEDKFEQALDVLSKSHNLKNTPAYIIWESATTSYSVKELTIDKPFLSTISRATGLSYAKIIGQIGDIMAKNKACQSLTFNSYNFYGEAEFEAMFLEQFIAGVANHASLTHLDVSGLYLHKAEILFESFVANSTRLSKLSLCRNSFTEDTKAKLAEWIESHDSPLEIDMRGRDGMRGNHDIPKSIVDAVTKNPQVTLQITADQLGGSSYVDHVEGMLTSRITVHEKEKKDCVIQ